VANPIKASDLYQDDGAIKKAIKDLEALQSAYETALKKINAEAIHLEVGVKKLNVANTEHREGIKKTAQTAQKLEKEYEKYNEALKESNVKIQALRNGTKQLNQVARLEAKLTASKAGSYNRLSAQYSLNKIRLNQLSKTERENTKEGRNLVKQSKEIYEEMKRLQEETGKTALNVGNYKESIKEALDEMGPFGGAINRTIGDLKRKKDALINVGKSLIGGTSLLQKFGIALAATGIGAIVLVLGSLVAYLTRTQEGIDFVNRKLAGFKAVADVFIDRLSAIGAALKKDFSGELKKAGKSLGSFFKDLVTFDYAGIAARIGGVTASVKGLVDEIKEEEKAAEELAGALQQVARDTQALEVRTARTRAEIKRLNLIAEDTTKTFAERSKAAAAAGAIERSLLKDREELLQRELAILEKQKGLGNSLFEDDQELADKRKEIALLQTESLELQTTINNKLNTINAQAAASTKNLNNELAAAAAILGGPAAEARREYDQALAKIEELRTAAKNLGEDFDFSSLKTLADAKYVRALDQAKGNLAALPTTLKKIESSTKGLGAGLKGLATQSKKIAEDEKENAFGEAFTSGLDAAKTELQSFMAARVQMADEMVRAAEQETNAAQSAYDKERELQADGLANRTEAARAELEQAKANQREAERNQKKAQRAQLAAQAAQQAANLVTATSKIWAQLGFPAALPATALLWGTFAASKIRALKSTKYKDGGFEMLTGGSHQSGRDISLGIGPGGVERRAEGGEAMAVFSKRAVRRYGMDLPGIVQNINRLSLDPTALRSGGGATVVYNANNKGMAKDIAAIRKQGEKQVMFDKEGRRIETYKNLTRTYG